MNVYFTPIGGNVQAGAFLHFNFRYNVSDDGGPVDERTLVVVVSTEDDATGKVKVSTDKAGKNECALPGPDPKKPNKNICQFTYDVPEEGKPIVAVALPSERFGKWGDLCRGVKENFCEFLLIGNFDQVSAKLRRGK